jgi:hypothetical protein
MVQKGVMRVAVIRKVFGEEELWEKLRSRG